MVGKLVPLALATPPRAIHFLDSILIFLAAWQAHFRTLHYFGCKRPANFLRSSTCQPRGFCLASRLKAGLQGW